MKKTGAAGIVLAALVVCSPASADETVGVPIEDGKNARNEEQDDAPVALLAGGSITLASLVTGGLLIARGENLFVKNAGLIGGQSGMALAPLVAHAVVGETKRGLWWTLPLLVPVATNSVLAGLFPSIIKRAPAGVQYATFIALTISIAGSTLGVLDAVRVGERRPKRAAAQSPSFSITPMFGETTGAMLSGSL